MFRVKIVREATGRELGDIEVSGLEERAWVTNIVDSLQKEKNIRYDVTETDSEGLEWKHVVSGRGRDL